MRAHASSTLTGFNTNLGVEQAKAYTILDESGPAIAEALRAAGNEDLAYKVAAWVYRNA